MKFYGRPEEHRKQQTWQSEKDGEALGTPALRRMRPGTAFDIQWRR